MVPFGLPHLERGLSGGKPNCPVDGENSTIPCSGSFVTFQSITWEEQSTFRPPQNPSSTFLPERSWRENSYLFTPADNPSCVHHLLSSANAAVLSSAAVPIRSSFLIIISYRGCGTFFSSEGYKRAHSGGTQGLHFGMPGPPRTPWLRPISFICH